jgi:hypothetical protein
MSSFVKMQHYVPRFYLGGFSSKGVINCYDITNSRKFPASVENIACEKGFYEIYKHPKNETERRLAGIERNCSKVIYKLIESEDLGSLKKQERIVLNYYVVIQELRTRGMREELRNILAQLKSALVERGLREGEKLYDEIKDRQNEEYYKWWQQSMFVDAPEFTRMLSSLRCVLVQNESEMVFWTSDNPVTRYNPVDLRPFGNLGLLSRGIQVYFPLTPRLSLLYYDPTSYAKLPENWKITDVENVKYHNSIQLLSSTRFLLSIDTDFAMADDYLRENPDIRDTEKRFRLTVK